MELLHIPWRWFDSIGRSEFVSVSEATAAYVCGHWYNAIQVSFWSKWLEWSWGVATNNKKKHSLKRKILASLMFCGGCQKRHLTIGLAAQERNRVWSFCVYTSRLFHQYHDRSFKSCEMQLWPISDSFTFCRLPYSSIFGGVSAMTVEQFQSVNGFSNVFFGWGGEDDDMSNRFFLFTKITRWFLFFPKWIHFVSMSI